MKQFPFFHVIAVAILFSFTSCKESKLESEFFNPPEDYRVSIYWYWINDNISKEGVVKDLQAMKEAGITRAFIGNIGGQTLFPEGNIKIFSDEWWDVLHTALKTAGELDIDIGIFNSPGWSQSGGPWVKPEQAMRYLASTELRVTGPQTISEKLIPSVKDFQDVKVLAFPLRPASNLFDIHGAKTRYSNNLSESFLELILPQATSARSLLIKSAGGIATQCELQIKENGRYKTVKTVDVNRSNLNLNVGFDPLCPVAVTFPEVNVSEYRLQFTPANFNLPDLSIVLSPVPLVERYPEKSLAKMYQWPLPYWQEYMWDVQTADTSLAVDPKQVIDISDKLAGDGTITWDVPAGEWLIMRTGMTPTGVTNTPAPKEGTGLEVDKMNKEHVAAHFDAFLGEILRRIPAEDRKSFKVIVEDSYETGGQNFTDGMIEAFSERYGYDPVPYLPAMQGYVVGSPDLSERFLWDLRRLIADKVAYDYVGGLREIGHKHGLTTWLENYGHWGFPGEFLQYGGQSDEIGGEFWTTGDLGNIECRAASSCAHIYGKTAVSAESFTSGADIGHYPAELKRRGDWSFTEGINKTLMHVYIQQPCDNQYPGIDAWFGSEFNRQNVWFGQFDLFVQYLRRCNYLLQQGLNVADVAYFIGEDAPKMTGITEPKLPKGYNFDYINSEVIIRDLQVKNGRLVLPHGVSYRLLVLPPQKTMRPELLRKIEQLVADGAVILGPKPSVSPSMKDYPNADKQVKELADKLWNTGEILSGKSMEEMFSMLNIVPDCGSKQEDPILYAHRTMGNTEIYFITNQSDKPVQVMPQFRVKNRKPELWNPVNGSARDLPAFEQHGEITSVPLQLETFESVFIVFRKKGKPSASSIEANFPKPELLAGVNTPWKVQFESDKIRRGPAETVVFNQLQDWSKNADERIRYYSGKAVYNNAVSLNNIPSGNIYLDLGKVTAMAKVKINGQYAGGVWTYPYRLDISKFIKVGENTLEVEVVNTWLNRVIGDAGLPESERIVISRSNSRNSDTPLQESGLLGPVKIVSVKY
ncbi:MAG: glycoside hydrolase family 2 [Dysgonamonadaceae bacterium]|jgi:hypothetical protein|nr:glycoside hydrolase family 2 [Dysgonamonadaceae bacterium]